MARVADQEDPFHSIEGIAGKTWKSIDSRSGALRVSLKDEAFIRIAGQCGLNLVDDLIRWTPLVS